jgi:signal transduction histidine kinase
LRNADRHTNDGEITVSAAVTDNEITFAVTDTGAGIDPELLPRVFERGISGETGGMGFGLSICRDIIEAHGGRIWLENEQGKGTTASFTLPVYKGKNTHAK